MTIPDMVIFQTVLRSAGGESRAGDRLRSPSTAARGGWLLDRVWLTAGVAGAALVWVGGSDVLFRAARHLAIIVSPLLPLVIADAALVHWTALKTTRAGSFESPTLAGPPAGRQQLPAG